MSIEVTQAALEPCPLCGDSMKTDNAGTFGHTDSNAKCLLARQAWALMPSYVDAWNTRLTPQSGEGRSGAGSECDSIDADLLGRMNRQLSEWDMDELRSDWWQYQRDFAEAYGVLSALNARQSGDDRGEVA